MKETIETIIQWQRETFPNATLEGQIEKFKDERKEWEQAEMHYEELWEAADMFIVACGIARFSLRIALGYFAEVENISSSYDGFDDAINEKMEINRKRQWNFNNGQYQHKGSAE